MSNSDNTKKIESIRDKLMELAEELTKLDNNIITLVIVSDLIINSSVFFTNGCARCQSELLVDSLDHNNIRHDSEDMLDKQTNEKVH